MTALASRIYYLCGQQIETIFSLIKEVVRGRGRKNRRRESRGDEGKGGKTHYFYSGQHAAFLATLPGSIYELEEVQHRQNTVCRTDLMFCSFGKLRSSTSKLFSFSEEGSTLSAARTFGVNFLILLFTYNNPGSETLYQVTQCNSYNFFSSIKNSSH